MKKNKRMTRDLEKSVATSAEAARDWAAPRVDAAYNWVAPRLERGYESASPKIQHGVQRAAHGISDGISTVTPRIQDGLDKVAPRISYVVDNTTPHIQKTLDRAAPAINNARDKVVGDYLPTLSHKLGDAADSVSRSLSGATIPEPLNRAVTKVTGDKKAVKKAQKAAAAAAMKASRDLKKRQKSGSKGWLIFGIIAAAITAGVAVWRASKPVEDPWKTPVKVKPNPRVRPSGLRRRKMLSLTSRKPPIGLPRRLATLSTKHRTQLSPLVLQRLARSLMQQKT